jgi:hypothetical protein
MVPLIAFNAYKNYEEALHCSCHAEACEQSVLPGPEQALPPVAPKFRAIWRKHSAISDF